MATLMQANPAWENVTLQTVSSKGSAWTKTGAVLEQSTQWKMLKILYVAWTAENFYGFIIKPYAVHSVKKCY